ncbi:hypothetical protein M413DRAFT_443784 [Hebeloma cylindrosporum]|uniref:Uncharacterized protein n=1 Tax=Hebeloma cylindrosporum TaxID=76867 RepID=A0A0C3CFL4_HEBCY|nr:hypothetical protein M413DRAFT_443784 [Hebeloma cylindrosporum h7]
MALTQSARLAGPSWDEEVVPALRKRLESESRTLARRMSAISLSSLDEQQNTNYSENTLRQKQPAVSSRQPQSSSSGAQRLQAAFQPDRKTPTTVGPRINGANHSSSKPNSKTDFQRARTYSSPYASDLPNGKGLPKNSAPKSMDPSRSISPRPVDVKPTRIPKAASRPPISLPTSATTSPQTNGYSHSAAVTPSPQSPELPYQSSPDQRGVAGAIPYSSTSSSVELSSHGNRTPGLLNESAPFPTEPTMSSGFSQQGHGEDPPRPSMESEERPYEHWYRGEVSRNGGVGELRVGKRQEMLDIANYGHLIESKKKAPNLKSRIPIAEDTPRQRKRAGSISGITDKERERGSLYLDEEHADEVGRVLDEHPLTDLDGEGSDINSNSSEYQGEAYAYMPGIGEAASAEWTATAGAHEIRSTTPTLNNMFHRPSSRQQQNLPPTRIPGPSSRRSSESRSTTATTPPSMSRGASEPIQSFSTASKTPSPPPAPSSSSNARPQYSSNTVPTSAQKRSAFPAAKKAKTAGKANRVKALQGKKEGQSNRGSVAYYPTPDGDDEDMADAIPSWTQPVHREGNWDEVVLPVVARKKGLDGHYEDANGSPQPKKNQKNVEPAPGTFGFDHSKYRPPRTDTDSIPMDEFGRPEDLQPSTEQDEKLVNGVSPMQEDGRLPFRNQPSPSPAPFSHYAPTSVKVVVNGAGGGQQSQLNQKEDDDKGAGCCQCVVM